MINPEYGSRNGERTRRACRFGRLARIFRCKFVGKCFGQQWGKTALRRAAEKDARAACAPRSCAAQRLWLACGIAASLLLASCSSKKEPAAGGARPPVPVTVAKVTAQDVPVQIQVIGSVQAYSTVAIRPQITGPILEVHFQEGQEVKAGDLLFTIDPRPWQAMLNQAQANLRRDEAQTLNARLEFLRTSNLFESKIASQADFETAEAQYLALQASAFADMAAITNAQISLGYTAIRSPIDGRTGSLAVKQGNVVKATDDVLLTITQTRPVYVAFAVPEQHLLDIRKRSAESPLRVEAYPPGDAAQRAVGQLTFIDNRVDTNTGTILLKGTFPNADRTLWPGQFVQTVLTLSNLVQATTVPAHAVQTGQNGDFVFVVTANSTVETRPVVTGITYEQFRIISKGLEPGDTVVTDGQLRLTAGARVNVKTEESSGGSNHVAEVAP